MTQKKPRLVLPLPIYQRLFGWVDLASGEVTGMMDVEYNQEDNTFVVTADYLIKQEAHSAEVDMTADDLSDLMLERVMAGSVQMPRLWWHSHGSMQAFFSGTDDSTIENFKNDSFLVALVVNKAKDMKAVVKLFKPFEYIIEDIAIDVDFTYSIDDAMRKEFAEKVDERPRTVVYSKSTPTVRDNPYMFWNKSRGWWEDKYGNQMPKDYYTRRHDSRQPSLMSQSQEGEPISTKGFESIGSVLTKAQKKLKKAWRKEGLLWLPNDEVTAATLVKNFKLERVWNAEKGLWMYKGNDISYIDYFGILDERAEIEEAIAAMLPAGDGDIDSVHHADSIHSKTDAEFMKDHAN